MKVNISIAETEWKVMELLWNEQNLTIGDIKKGLEETGWSDSTVKTLVRRLVQKGAIKADDTLGQFRYSPLVGESECKRKETKNLIDRIYNGSVKMLMANLVSDSNLTDEEAMQLFEIIDKMEGDKK